MILYMRLMLLILLELQKLLLHMVDLLSEQGMRRRHDRMGVQRGWWHRIGEVR
jgi:hypothetical protein